METWATVALVLGSNIIFALASFFATRMQVSHSDRRFQIEQQLEQQRIVREMNENNRQRRREVRSEPLLKVRDELARMANKQDKLVAAASRQHTRIGGTDEEAKRELQEAAEDWNAYVRSGDFAQTLLIQYDTDLVNKVEEIRKDYQKSYFYHLHLQQIDIEKLSEAMEIFEKNRNKIVEVQELINKRLEEL
jgi:hypothetical protein